jgi:hypothetical protein
MLDAALLAGWQVESVDGLVLAALVPEVTLFARY